MPPRLLLKAAFGKGKGGGRNTAKKVAIYIIKRYSGLGNQEIGTLFGGMHYSAVTKASARLETEMTQDKDLRSIVKEILANIKTQHSSTQVTCKYRTSMRWKNCRMSKKRRKLYISDKFKRLFLTQNWESSRLSPH